MAKKMWLWISAAGMASLAPTWAVAQVAGSGTAAGEATANDLDTIVVTAQKRSERLTDVPLSTTALSGGRLAQQGINSVDQLERVVPGFTFQKAVYGAPVFALRGVGFYDTSVTNTPAVAVYNARAQLDWAPTDRLTLAFAATGWRDLSDTQAQQFFRFVLTTPPNPFNTAPYTALGQLSPTPRDARLAGWNAARDYGRDDYFYKGSLRGDLELGADLTFTSISAYSRYHENSAVDADGTAYFGHEQNVRADIESYFQEARIAGRLNRLTFTLGGNYSKDDTREAQITSIATTNAGIGPARDNCTRQSKDQKTETGAVFASADYDLTDTLTLQGALRYTAQNRDFRGCLADKGNRQLAAAFNFGFNAGATPGNCVTMDAPGSNRSQPIIADSLDQDNLSWRASLRWKPADDTMLYASATKGKAGSFPLIPSVYAFQLTPVTQEALLAYEIGFKTDLADRKVQLSGAVFYYDYKNKQLMGYVQVPPLGNLATLVSFPESSVIWKPRSVPSTGCASPAASPTLTPRSGSTPPIRWTPSAARRASWESLFPIRRSGRASPTRNTGPSSPMARICSSAAASQHVHARRLRSVSCPTSTSIAMRSWT